MKSVTMALVPLTLLALLLVPAAFAQDEKPVVAATTTVLGSVVRDLAGDRVEVVVILNPSLCPAHYDVRPSDVYLLQRANLILYHGFEPWMDRLVEAARASAPLVKVSGPWNTPEGLEKYYEAVKEALEEHLGLDVSEGFERSLARLKSVEGELKGRAEELGVSKVKVISMAWQKPFLSWLGFQIVADYPPPEKLSSKDLVELVEVGKREGVVMVVDNLQSGTGFGRTLAERIGALHVVLTNFPETEPGVSNVTNLYEHNAETLFASLRSLSYMLEAQGLRGELQLYQALTYSLIVVAAVEAVFIGYLTRRGKSAKP